MDYCKIIIDNMIVNVCNIFAKWMESRKCLIPCSPDEAQFAISSDGIKYRNRGMIPLFTDEVEYTEADVVMIEEEEYNQLLEELSKDDVESIQVPEEIIQEISEISEPEPEVMSISAMRQKIIELTELIEKLTKKTESAAD